MLEILLYAGRAIMPLLLTMALGCWLRRSAHWSDDFYRQLNSFCFHVLLPVQLFLNVYAIEDLSVLNWRLLGFIVLCIVGAAGLGVAVAPLFARERAQRVVIAQATFRANQVIMGIPLASALGGQDALIFASLVTSVCVPVFNMLAVLMLTAYSTDGKSISWREEVRQIFRNPLILGALAGLVTVLTIVGISTVVSPSGSRSSNTSVRTINGTTTRRMDTAARIFFHRPCTASNRSRAPRISSTSGEATLDRSLHAL